MVTALGRLSAADLLAVVRACDPFRLRPAMGRYFRPFLARYFGPDGGAFAALTDDELAALYDAVRHLQTLRN
jgi:hypothetical protein